jgi:hypothetical protein
MRERLFSYSGIPPRCLVAVFFVVSMLSGSHTSAANPNINLSEMVDEQTVLVQHAFGITPRVEKISSGLHQSFPSGVVQISLQTLEADFASVPPAVLPLMIRWIVAHEYWHQIQFRDHGPSVLSGDDDSRRLSECEADIMAATFGGLRCLRNRG